MKLLLNTSTMIDYFTEDGLRKKTGLSEDMWNEMLFKELMDNALDAVESCQEKRIEVSYDTRSETLQVFDNGSGISEKSLESIYDFSVYHSSKRHYITPSRGQQGNGLKTVICVCFLNGYGLFWHTREGCRIQYSIDAEGVSFGRPPEVTCIDRADTGKRGIEIAGVPIRESWVHGCTYQYHLCNPDVNVTITIDGESHTWEATAAACDKSKDTNIAFYNLESFSELVQRQEPGQTYKAFLSEVFGQRISNKSRIRAKIQDVDTRSKDFAEDFEALKASQKGNGFPVMRKHLTGLPYCFECQDEETKVPYIVEFDVTELEEKKKFLSCICMVNNSVTYYDDYSITFEYGTYQIGKRQAAAGRDLCDILEPYRDYDFTFHFICPRPEYKDAGKTKIDITGIMPVFVAEVSKAIRKEHKQTKDIRPAKISKRDLMRTYLPQAYEIASSGGKYAITARQVFYKLRELSGIEETSGTYSEFTQTVLTEWLNDNPEAEEKIYYSDRGKFIIGNTAAGIGTGSVRNAISRDTNSRNRCDMDEAKAEDIHFYSDFSLKYRYNRALYIEKTGFDQIFKAEHIGDKHNMIIVSGQGFGTRAAKTLLYHLQSQGLQIFCLHDLDYSGLNIINSLRYGNEKFNEDISVIDIGITPEDVRRYDIQPESVPITKDNKIDITKYTAAEQDFLLDGRGNYRRVELNAFTTEQILEIIDRKLSRYTNSLPTVNLKDVLHVDQTAIKKAALMQVMLEKYSFLLDEIETPEDIIQSEDMTVKEIEAAAGSIVDTMMQNYQRQILQRI